MKWCRKHQSEYPFGQLASGVGEKGKTPKFLNDLMGHLVVNKLSKPMFTSYDVNSAPNEYIAKTRESMPVFAWTIRIEKDLEKARGYADNIIFEYLSLDLLK